MADEKASAPSAWAEFKWFFIILGILFLAWWFTGGPQRASKEDKFIQEPTGLQPGETYDQPVSIFGKTF